MRRSPDRRHPYSWAPSVLSANLADGFRATMEGMEPNSELLEFLERVFAENIDSLEVVEKLMAIKESDDDDSDIVPPDSPVWAPVKPRLHLNSGGIALPETD